MDASEKTTKAGGPGWPPPGKPYISVASGRHAGRLYPIERGAPRLLGRSAECKPRFPTAENVSKVHAEVWLDESGVVWLRDKSRNGTSVGGKLVHGERVALEHGDWIILGKETDALRAEWLSDEEVDVRILPFVDALTGLGTRLHLAGRLADLLDSKEDSEAPLAVMMLDIDHFGRFNKSHGQTTGDEVLRGVGACLRASVEELHPGGDAGRHGGEEFVIMLPHCSLERAVEIAEACRERIEALELQRSGNRLRVSASFGVDACQPRPELQLDDLVDLANPHLKRAKNLGRNRTCWRGDGAEEKLASDAAN